MQHIQESDKTSNIDEMQLSRFFTSLTRNKREAQLNNAHTESNMYTLSPEFFFMLD